jgi:hypothetical protein
MDAITLQKKDSRLILSLDENYVSKDTLTKLIDRLKLEHLLEKADFDESIVDLGEQIKADWWAKNKDRFLGRTE